MKKYIYKLKFAVVALLLTTVSCNDFLDELPDNRTQVDSKVKIQKLLNSAYLSDAGYTVVAELSSDNIADYGSTNPNTSKFLEQAAYWRDITETDNDDLKRLWGEAYGAIANANQALDAIEKNSSKEDLSAEKGEALIARAYLHFVLVNMFGKHYNKTTSDKDLGIVYMSAPETKLNPTYARESVKSVYEKIEKDIEKGLPLINDAVYKVPKFHFTRAAAYAFAARFYLYYENWEKAEKYATLALNANGQMRKWDKIATLPREGGQIIAKAYFEDNSNYLLQTASSNAGLIFGAYYTGARFNHTAFINQNLTMYAFTPWSEGVKLNADDYIVSPGIYNAANLDKTLFFKIPRLFQTIDPVAGTGYGKTVTVPFYSEETLLTRAEARILQGNFEGGLEDINKWASNFYKTNSTVTIEQVNKFYEALPQASQTMVSLKYKLNPKFAIQAGTQENLLQYLLYVRRVLTLHEGLRWFDIKRYGIEVFRILYDSSNSPKIVETLPVDDERRALQLPLDVLSAGLEANPR